MIEIKELKMVDVKKNIQKIETKKAIEEAYEIVKRFYQK